MVVDEESSNACDDECEAVKRLGDPSSSLKIQESQKIFNRSIRKLPGSSTSVSRLCVWLLQISKTIEASQTVGRICDVITRIIIIVT